jgi:uncharacterized membrane protein
LKQIDAPRIEQAITRAEAGTSSEIRVSVAGFFRGDPRALGERAFRRLGMTATRHRNGVLILVAPTRRTVVILGDSGLDGRVDDSFWSGLADHVGQRFKEGDFTGGLVDIVERIGRALALHFPADPGSNVNELTNAIDVVPGPR